MWLGHATSRVEMPGVTGGTIPAKIWGQYMKQARGTFCGDFRQPRTAFNPQPFRGRYAGGGGGSTSATASRRPRAPPPTPADGDDAGKAAGRERQRRTAAAAAAAATPAAVVARPAPGTGGAGFPGDYESARTSADRGASRGRRMARHPLLRSQGMPKEEKVEFEGEVVEALPNAMFRVKLDNDHVVLGHVAGKMRRFRIRILPGDRVRVELSPYDLDRARIVYRHR